jgi:protein TonB
MKTRAESFEDIIFENRNKEYGAYELRKRYSKRGTIALIISMTILFFVVGGPLIASILEQRAYKRYLEKNAAAEMMNIKEVNRDDVAPPPPPPPPPAVKEIKFVAPKIVDTLTNEEQELATTEDLAKSVKIGSVDTTTPPLIVIVDVPEKLDNDKPFEPYAIQEKPVFPGGESALIKYVGEHTKYPVVAQEQGIEGTVYIRFVVTKTGDVGITQVMRAVDPLLEGEALRVVKTLPKWTPGKNNGNPVSVWFIIPVKFKLE